MVKLLRRRSAAKAAWGANQERFVKKIQTPQPVPEAQKIFASTWSVICGSYVEYDGCR